MIIRALCLLLLSPMAFADPGCTGVQVSDPVILVDRAMSHAQGYATVSITCTEGLPFALESPHTPGGFVELTSGTGATLPAVLRDADTGAPLGPIAHNEQVGRTGTGGAQSIPVRVDVDLNPLPEVGRYGAVVVLNVEF